MHSIVLGLVLVWMAALQAPTCPMAVGASFWIDRQGDFHCVFTSDLSSLQGEYTSLVQVLIDSSGDVPLLSSCFCKELQVNVQAKVSGCTSTSWHGVVQEVWSSLVHIQEQSSS